MRVPTIAFPMDRHRRTIPFPKAASRSATPSPVIGPVAGFSDGSIGKADNHADRTAGGGYGHRQLARPARSGRQRSFPGHQSPPEMEHQRKAHGWHRRKKLEGKEAPLVKTKLSPRLRGLLVSGVHSTPADNLLLASKT